MALKPRSAWGFPLTLAALATIGWFTLRPAPADAEAAARMPWTCLYPCGDYGLRDAILNVALFVPLGLALALWLRPSRAVLGALLATATVEFIQYRWLLGRDASLRDILTNTLGATIGIAIAPRWRRLLLPGPRRSGALAALAATLWLATVAGTAALVRPTLPRSVYWGQWAPELGQFAHWEGTVLAATVAGYPLPMGRLRHSDRLRALLLRDSVVIEARVLPGPAPSDLAPIVSVFDSDQREILVLGQLHDGLVFRLRSGLSALEVGDLSAYLPALPETAPGDTLTIRGGVVHGAWLVAAESRGGHAERRVPFGAGLLWSALLPYRPVLGPLAALWSGLWLATLLLPAGYWCGRAGRSGLALAAGCAVVLGGMSPLFGLAVPPAAEWCGVVLGALAGTAAGRWSRRFPGDDGQPARVTLH